MSGGDRLHQSHSVIDLEVGAALEDRHDDAEAATRARQVVPAEKGEGRCWSLTMSGEGTIKTRCPACHTSYRVPPSSIGHRARCAKCHEMFRVADTTQRHWPSEDDIVNWLNEGLDEESLASRPRVLAAGDSGVHPAADSETPTEAIPSKPGPRRWKSPPARRAELNPPTADLLENQITLRKTG